MTDVSTYFDATSLYPSATRNEKSKYPKNETGYAFTPDMNDEIVEKFKTLSFTQGSAILNVFFYNPSDLKFQHLAVREKIKNTELDRMKSGYIVDTLPSVDKPEGIKLGSKVKKNYEGVICKENFTTVSFKKVIKLIFNLGQKNEEKVMILCRSW